MKKTVTLGMSGGVDSAAAAILLTEKGYETIALYFDVLKEENSDAKLRARKVADALGLSFISRNVSAEFEEGIINPFCSEYKFGRTPIPCVFCNPMIKFRTLAETDSDLIATGHYARIKESGGRFYVAKAANSAKDQSYMLARLPQEILCRTVFPLGEIESKDEVRKLVADKGLSISSEKDSQDICFINGSYKDFLRDRGVESIKGNFVSPDGRVYGPNEGIANYTVGQRKGIGIALGMPAFVSEIRPDSGDVVLTSDEKDLYKSEVSIDNLLVNGRLEDKKYQVKLRYAAKPAECKVLQNGDSAMLYFDEAQRAPTPGQAAVIYDGDIVIASGIIYN